MLSERDPGMRICAVGRALHEEGIVRAWWEVCSRAIHFAYKALKNTDTFAYKAPNNKDTLHIKALNNKNTLHVF